MTFQQRQEQNEEEHGFFQGLAHGNGTLAFLMRIYSLRGSVLLVSPHQAGLSDVVVYHGLLCHKALH